MLIDWFTVGAQVINFLLLLWLMKHFLYTPVLAAIEVREKHIAGELAGAASQKAAAETARLGLAAKIEAFDAERATLLARAVADAGVERDRLAAESRAAADAARRNGQAQWQKDRAAQVAQLNKMVTDEVFAISRQVLRDLSGAELQERLVAIFVGRVRAMAADASAVWVGALQMAARDTTPLGNEVGVRVKSRYALASSSRALIQTAVDGSGCTVPLRFETASDDVDGIEVIAADQRIAWTVTDYLRSLQNKVQAMGREAESPSLITASSSTDAPPAKGATPALAAVS